MAPTRRFRIDEGAVLPKPPGNDVQADRTREQSVHAWIRELQISKRAEKLPGVLCIAFGEYEGEEGDLIRENRRFRIYPGQFRNQRVKKIGWIAFIGCAFQFPPMRCPIRCFRAAVRSEEMGSCPWILGHGTTREPVGFGPSLNVHLDDQPPDAGRSQAC
ncbi:MAG: hypothetical protein AAF982_09350 [Pseudomonadota bacterium]